MKFYNYLNEDEVSYINKIIQEDCQSYLNLIKKIGGYILTRSMRSTTLDNKQFGINNVRKNRKSQGMKPGVFKQFNEWLDKNEHNRRDQSVSVSAESHELFGDRFYFFPIGKFSYSGVESRDVNMEGRRSDGYENAVEEYLRDPESFDEDYKTKLKKPFADYFHTNEGISTAYKNNFEVWFNCKEYYYVSVDDYYGDNVSKEIIRR